MIWILYTNNLWAYYFFVFRLYHVSVLNFSIVNYTPDLPVEKTRRALVDAFKVWSGAAKLSFTEVRSRTADILIQFESRYHQDGYPFDGNGKLIYSPWCSVKCIQVIDFNFANNNNYSKMSKTKDDNDFIRCNSTAPMQTANLKGRSLVLLKYQSLFRKSQSRKQMYVCVSYWVIYTR